MRDEFGFDRIRSVEFCANFGDSKKGPVNYLVPSDESVQDALKEVLAATVAAFGPDGDDWAAYELSEKYAATESLRADRQARRWRRSGRSMMRKDGR